MENNKGSTVRTVVRGSVLRRERAGATQKESARLKKREHKTRRKTDCILRYYPSYWGAEIAGAFLLAALLYSCDISLSISPRFVPTFCLKRDTRFNTLYTASTNQWSSFATLKSSNASRYK